MRFTAQPFPTTRRPRRRLWNNLLYGVLTVALTTVALTLWSAHRIRQAEEAVTDLRRLGVHVSETLETNDFWLRFARAVGVSSDNGLFERSVYAVTLDAPAAPADALRAAARLPGLSLRIRNTPDVDDALAALQDCTELRDIVFYKSGVTDAGLKHLQNGNRLQSVGINECPVTDEGIRFLCGLPAPPSVRCGNCLTETKLVDLAYASPGAPMPLSGRPLTIAGRLCLKTPLPVATATLRFFVSNEDASAYGALQASARLTLDAANEAAFAVTAKNGGAELQPGRNFLYVLVMVPSTPAIHFHLDYVLPAVKPNPP